MRYFLTHSIRQNIKPCAFSQAIYFGEARSESEAVNTRPGLYIIFPYLKQSVTRNDKFLKIWHDDIVGPAFNRAWEDSGLVDLFRMQNHVKKTISGNNRQKMAHPAINLIHHLQNNKTNKLREQWPEFHDPEVQNNEGKYTGLRSNIFDEAWKSILGMVKDHPQLGGEFQDPFLLVVHEIHIDINQDMSVQDKYGSVGRNWDLSIDSRYIVPKSFKVIVETTLGGKMARVKGQLKTTQKKRKRDADGERKGNQGRVSDEDGEAEN
ncbi:uncharacterized protein BDR25DRAFT_379381 [Lindgomyces ingoldianus]|uniref:Uncharacterized protein n=1 Tax=Lindgomyces ingoldianus TaxID=673940 RepID=A0ACB6R9G3_9PLEO|nr:uncharacterized protein BDR25DRAFT_379381 [Lindgomyces ingoldianus]KAF2475816.1 hypothetical protein BDR25DRAFT_379381 [Lindgomyces ingoldianus]